MKTKEIDYSLTIETVSGKIVNISNPNADDIVLQDIAWALSRIPRFAGHTITEVPYNVAQHSIYVSKLVETILKDKSNSFINGDIYNYDENIIENIETIRNTNTNILLQALFHDAAEAYTGDIPSPIKKLPTLGKHFKDLEKKLDIVIFKALGLVNTSTIGHSLIKYCDKMAQAIEGYQFMPSRGLNWNLPKPSLIDLQSFSAPKTSIESYKDFIFRYEYLISQ